MKFLQTFYSVTIHFHVHSHFQVIPRLFFSIAAGVLGDVNLCLCNTYFFYCYFVTCGRILLFNFHVNQTRMFPQDPADVIVNFIVTPMTYTTSCYFFFFSLTCLQCFMIINNPFSIKRSRFLLQ